MLKWTELSITSGRFQVWFVVPSDGFLVSNVKGGEGSNFCQTALTAQHYKSEHLCGYIFRVLQLPWLLKGMWKLFVLPSFGGAFRASELMWSLREAGGL